MPTTYSLPFTQINSQGALTQLVGGLSPTTIKFVGTSYKGPDVPTLISATDFVSTFGDPALSASFGHTLPYALSLAAIQRSRTGYSPWNALCLRIGVTRGVATLFDTGGSTAAISLQAVGPYAGSASQYLSYITTNTAGVVTLSFFDTRTGSTLQTFTSSQYNLTSNSSIVAALNGANPTTDPQSIVFASLETPVDFVLLGANMGVFSTGNDGLGTLPTSPTIAPLLSASLLYSADYIWAGFDAATAWTAFVGAHIAAAIPSNQRLKFVGGPAALTTSASLRATSGGYNTINSAAAQVIGHDVFLGAPPASPMFPGPRNGQPGWSWDGFMAAAALVGLCASSPVAQTNVGDVLSGFSGVGVPPDNGGFPLGQQALTAIAGNGFAVFTTVHAPAKLNDLSTAPPLVNGATNPAARFNLKKIDDMVSKTLAAAVSPYLSDPMPPSNRLIARLTRSADNALATLVSDDVINGFPGCGVSIDPSTLAITVSASYITRWGPEQIIVNTGYTFV